MEELIQEFPIAETVAPQEKGELQVTSGGEYWKDDALKQTGVPLTFEYGITDRFQVELEAPYIFLKPEAGTKRSGPGDVEAGFLYNILKKDEPVALSVAAEIGVPTGDEDKGLGEGETEWGTSVILAKRAGKGQVHLGLGGEFSGDEAGFFYNLSGVYPFGKLSGTLELSGRGGDEHSLYLVPGVVWRLDAIADELELGAGVARGLTADSADWGLVFKATLEFGL